MNLSMNPESAKEEESPGQLPNGTESQSTGLDKPRRARGAPPGSRNNLKHGLYAYKAMLDGDGLDQRTSLFKAFR